jgi:hypothetical protein
MSQTLQETTVLLLDLSTSMNEFVGHTGRTRRDVLEQAVVNLLLRHPNVLVFAFGSDVLRVTDPTRGLPPSLGGTDLKLALDRVRAQRPTTVIVVSDGEPNDAKAALTSALLLNCKIGTVYCGDEENAAAIAFLRDLVRCSRTGTIGTSAIVSLEKPPEEVADQLVLQLAGPAR